MILAVPDTHRVARLFKFGKLRAARDALQYSRLEPGDTGFEQIVAIHNRSQPDVETIPDIVEYIQYGPQVTLVSDTDERGGLKLERLISSFSESGVGLNIKNRVHFEFSDEYPQELDFDVERLSRPPVRAYSKINQSIERSERRWRLFGVLVIVTGFASQLAAAIVY